MFFLRTYEGHASFDRKVGWVGQVRKAVGTKVRIVRDLDVVIVLEDTVI